MKKLLIVLFCLAFGMPTHPVGAAGGLRQIRSLTAANVTAGGVGETDGVALQNIAGGGMQWVVLITGTAPNFPGGVQIQVQMTDGTWVVATTMNQNAATFIPAGSVATTNQCWIFFGPFQAMRVVVIANAGNTGTLVADIFATT